MDSVQTMQDNEHNFGKFEKMDLKAKIMAQWK